MSLFINNNSGPVYHECNVTIHQESGVKNQEAGDRSQEAGEAAAPNDILPIPPEGKYSDVRRYIEERKRFDEEFKAYVETHSRVALCKRLSEEFGWTVDHYALGRNINRNRK
ncbi:MAG: hypothetical protein J6T80_05055 [Paludibacteraceae bacterium]|nr:hypothetical protein [Paludibacteraceae bacterium]